MAARLNRSRAASRHDERPQVGALQSLGFQGLDGGRHGVVDRQQARRFFPPVRQRLGQRVTGEAGQRSPQDRRIGSAGEGWPLAGRLARSTRSAGSSSSKAYWLSAASGARFASDSAIRITSRARSFRLWAFSVLSARIL